MQRRAIVTTSVAAAVLAVGGAIAGFTASGGSSSAQNGVTVKTATVHVDGTNETILETAKGLPLYIYKPDSPTQSQVTGQLAALWPPLTAGSPKSGIGQGQLAAVKDIHGNQVEYNGHLLYTFVSDRPGVVTGQGVQNFFVATPDLTTPPGTPTRPGAAWAWSSRRREPSRRRSGPSPCRRPRSSPRRARCPGRSACRSPCGCRRPAARGRAGRRGPGRCRPFVLPLKPWMLFSGWYGWPRQGVPPSQPLAELQPWKSITET